VAVRSSLLVTVGLGGTVVLHVRSNRPTLTTLSATLNSQRMTWRTISRVHSANSKENWAGSEPTMSPHQRVSGRCGRLLPSRRRRARRDAVEVLDSPGCLTRAAPLVDRGERHGQIGRQIVNCPQRLGHESAGVDQSRFGLGVAAHRLMPRLRSCRRSSIRREPITPRFGFAARRGSR
jgi:hypothetical protein